MTSTYAAPLGIAPRPFGNNGVAYSSFPGEPQFGTPAGSSISGLPFPIGNGPGGQTGGIDGFAAGVLSANRVQNWPSNGFVAYHYVVVPNKNDRDSASRISRLGLGMLCFSRDMAQGVNKQRAFRKNSDTMVGSTAVNYGNTVGERSAEVFELTQLNEHLRVPEVSDNYESAAQVLHEFRFLGVILAEVAPATDHNFGGRPSSRVVNFVVRGKCRTFNFWPGAFPAHTELWLIVKKYQPKVGSGRLVWALQPYASLDKPRPTLDEICWIEGGKVKVGAAIYIGHTGQNIGDIAYDARRDVRTQSLYDTIGSPQIELFIRV